MNTDSLPVYEAMSTLRAVRRLKPDPIPDDVLRRILQAAAWAPSGGNRQPWRIIVVREPGPRETIGKLYQQHWSAYAQVQRAAAEKLESPAREKMERTLAAADYLGEHMGQAPVLLVACFNPDRMAITDQSLERPSVVGGGSVYPAIQNLMLACVAEGIGCTLTTLLCFEEDAIKELLEIPDDWYTCAVIPLGYPVGSGHGPITRKPVEELCYSGKFGSAIRFGN